MNDAHIHDIIAWCARKARYFGLIGIAQRDAWTAFFAKEFVLETAENGGSPTVTGRIGAVAMVRQTIGTDRTAHHFHKPLITRDVHTANGILAMQHRVVFEGDREHDSYGRMPPPSA